MANLEAKRNIRAGFFTDSALVTDAAFFGYKVPDANTFAPLLSGGNDPSFALHASGRPVIIYSGPPRRATFHYEINLTRMSGTNFFTYIHLFGTGTNLSTIPTNADVISAGNETSITTFRNTIEQVSVRGFSFVDLVNGMHVAPMWTTFFAAISLRLNSSSILISTLEP